MGQQGGQSWGEGGETHVSQIVEVNRHLLRLPVREVLESLLVLVVRALPALCPLPALLPAALLRALVLVQKVVLVAQLILINRDVPEVVRDGLLRGGLELRQEELKGACCEQRSAAVARESQQSCPGLQSPTLLLLVIDGRAILSERHFVRLFEW